MPVLPLLGSLSAAQRGGLVIKVRLSMKILISIIGFAASGGYRVLSELANKWMEVTKWLKPSVQRVMNW